MDQSSNNGNRKHWRRRFRELIGELSDCVEHELTAELTPTPVGIVLDPAESAAFAIADQLRAGLPTVERSVVYVAKHPSSLPAVSGDVWVCCIRADADSYNATTAIDQIGQNAEYAVLVAYSDSPSNAPGLLYDLEVDFYLHTRELDEALPDLARAVTWQRRHLFGRLHRQRLRRLIEQRYGLDAVRQLGMEPRAPACRPLSEVEAEAILTALHVARGSKSLAAELLGIARGTLYRKLRAYRLLGYSTDDD